MKTPILAFLLLLTACHTASAHADAPNPAVDMNGTVQISFEQAEFSYQGQTYYLDDERGVLNEWIKQQRAASKAFFIKQNVCLNGTIRTRAQKIRTALARWGGMSGRLWCARCVDAGR